MFTQTESLTASLMLSKFQNTVDEKFSFLKTAELYLAISGGKDSMTLSHLLLKSGMKHTLLHCNFQLRGMESDQDEEFLKSYAEKNGLQIKIQKFNTAQIAEEQKLSIQECARNLRYEWFRKFIDGKSAAFLLTAHHLDDSIETFFINLLRGTGFRGLTGIPVLTRQIVRPLSDFTTEEIYRYIDSNQIDYRSDSSNAHRNYLRNKIRHDLVPILADIQPDFRLKYRDLFGDMNDAKDLIDLEAQLFREKHEEQKNATSIFKLEVIRNCTDFFREQVFRPFGIYRKNSHEFNRFLTTSTGSKFYTDTHQFWINRTDLIVGKRNTDSEKICIEISTISRTIKLEKLNLRLELKTNFELIRDNTCIQQLDFDRISFPITIRSWEQGDRIQPLGMSGTKLVSDILIDKKIGFPDKENQVVIVDSHKSVICLVGLVVAEFVKIQSDTSRVLELNLESGFIQ